MDLFPLEARKYALRWSIFGAALLYLGLLISWAAIGHFPIVDRIRITPSYDLLLPIQISRWYDGLAVMVPVWLGAYIIFRGEAINRRYRDRWSREKPNKYPNAISPIYWGILIGACGLLPVTPAGFGGISIATPIVLVIIIVASLESRTHTYQIVLCCIMVILVIWAGETALVGAIAGFVYAGSILIYTLSMVIGVPAAAAIAMFIWGIFEIVIFDLLLPERFEPNERVFPNAKYILLRRPRPQSVETTDSAAA